MPLITAMTAIKVVVARMIPRSVRKLRSLLDRSEAAAPSTASQKDALDSISLEDEADDPFVPVVEAAALISSPQHFIWDRACQTAGQLPLLRRSRQVSLAQDSDMVRHMPRDNEGQGAHAEGIVAGDAASRPCLARHIAKE